MSAELSGEVRAVNPLAFPRWDEMVSRFTGASVFHSAGWAAVLARTYGHSLSYWTQGPEGEPLAVLPLAGARSVVTGARGVCLPRTDFCPPLLKAESDFLLLWDAALAAGKAEGWRYIEVRGDVPVPAAVPSITYCAHMLDLRVGRESVARGFHPSARRAVRKAHGSGIQVRFGTAPEDVDAYYRLHCLTRRRHGLPPQPKTFFNAIGEHMLRRGLGFVALASAGKGVACGHPIAATLFLHFGRQAIFKFGASDFRFQELRANSLVMSESIHRCLELGMEELHFGRTDECQDGLRRFKLGWGACEKPLHYYRYGIEKGDWRNCRSHAKGWHNVLFGSMPFSINRLLGAILYRHVD